MTNTEQSTFVPCDECGASKDSFIHVPGEPAFEHEFRHSEHNNHSDQDVKQQGVEAKTDEPVRTLDTDVCVKCGKSMADEIHKRTAGVYLNPNGHDYMPSPSVNPHVNAQARWEHLRGKSFEQIAEQIEQLWISSQREQESLLRRIKEGKAENQRLVVALRKRDEELGTLRKQAHDLEVEVRSGSTSLLQSQRINDALRDRVIRYEIAVKVLSRLLADSYGDDDEGEFQ